MASATTIVPEGVTLRWSALGPVGVRDSPGKEVTSTSGAGAGSKVFASWYPCLDLNLDWRRRGTGVKLSLIRPKEWL